MHCHANARLTPRGRAAVFELVEAGMTVSAACLAARVSRRFYYRWLPRWQAARHDGLVDRSSRPRTSPQRVGLLEEATIVAVRQRLGWGPDRLAALLGLPASTVYRVLRRHGLVGRKREPVPVVRYEHAEPGGLVHLDTKKLGRIVDGPGHRATGDRRSRRRGVGWEVLHVAIDDATRLVYAELLPDEKGRTTARRWAPRCNQPRERTELDTRAADLPAAGGREARGPHPGAALRRRRSLRRRHLLTL